MDKVKFISSIQHLCWCCYQLGAGQEYNLKINEDQAESLRDGVNFLLANPGTSPEQSHKNWMKKKKDQGWVYGSVKDFEKKTHPDLVPFEELPQVEQNKDVMSSISHEGAVELYKELGFE